MLATEEMLEVGKILRGGEFGVGQWVVDQGDGMAEAGDGGGLVGDATVFFFDLTVGLEEVCVGEGLWGFHGPKAVALEVFE